MQRKTKTNQIKPKLKYVPIHKRKITKPLKTLEKIPKLMHDENQGQIRIFEISLTKERTMEVRALVDTGATLSFISERLVKKLIGIQSRLTVKETRPFNVRAANGEITFSGKYINLNVRQNHSNYFWQDIKFFVDSGDHLPKIDVILGINDLKLLGIFMTTLLDGHLIFKNQGKIYIADEIRELQDNNKVGYDYDKVLKRLTCLKAEKTLSTTNYCDEDRSVKSIIDVKRETIEFLEPKLKKTTEDIDIETFNFTPGMSEQVRKDIREKIMDLYQRKGYHIASKVWCLVCGGHFLDNGCVV